MKTPYQYINWSTAVFEGFYDSNLYNSDSEYYLSEYLSETEGEPYELKDWDAFTKDVAERAVHLLDEYSDDAIISGMTLDHISSPRYYNFETDKLVINCNVDFEALAEYAMTTRRDNFAEYLNDNFKSRDGFISFVPCALDDFAYKYTNGDDVDKSRCRDVMIDFYLLDCIADTDYSTELSDYALSALYEYSGPVDDDNNTMEA